MARPCVFTVDGKYIIEAPAGTTLDPDLINVDLSGYVPYFSPTDKRIVLENNKGYQGTAPDTTVHNLAMVNEWGQADFGSGNLPFNINSQGRPTTQLHGESGPEAHQMAFLADFNLEYDTDTGRLSLKDMDGVEHGFSILPLDKFLKEASVVTDPEGQPPGVYLKLVMATEDGGEDTLYVAVSEFLLVDPASPFEIGPEGLRFKTGYTGFTTADQNFINTHPTDPAAHAALFNIANKKAFVSTLLSGTGVDLDTYQGETYAGLWAFRGSDPPANSPLGTRSIYLNVEVNANNPSTLQTVYERANNNPAFMTQTFRRIYYSGAWSPWINANNGSLIALSQSAGNDLNDYKGPQFAGLYSFSGSNRPTNVPAEFGNGRAGFLTVKVTADGTSTYQMWHDSGSSNMTAGIVGRTWVRIGYGQIWSEWTEFKSMAWGNTNGGFPIINARGGLDLGTWNGPINSTLTNIGNMIVARTAGGSQLLVMRVNDGVNSAGVISVGSANGADTATPTPSLAGDQLGVLQWLGLRNNPTTPFLPSAMVQQIGYLDTNADLDTAYPDSYLRWRLGKGTTLQDIYMKKNVFYYGSPDSQADLGSTNYRWKDGHFAGSLKLGPIPAFNFPNEARINVIGTDTLTSRISTAMLSNDINGPQIHLSKGRGTAAAPLPAIAGDTLGSFQSGRRLAGGSHLNAGAMMYRLSGSADMSWNHPTGYWHFTAGNNGTTIDNVLYVGSGSTHPGVDNLRDLGTTVARWKDGNFAGNLFLFPLTSTATPIPYPSRVNVVGNSLNTSRISALRVSNDTVGGNFLVAKARGIAGGVSTPVQAGDSLGNYSFGATFDGTSYSVQAVLEYLINNTADLGTAFPKGIFRLRGGSDGTGVQSYFQFSDEYISPVQDNVRSCGIPSGRFSVVYAATGTINTSDERYKENITDLLDDEEFLEAWIEHVKPVFYQWIDSINDKGEDDARIHAGVLAQDVEKAFKAIGRDAGKYGVFCYDKWDDQYEPTEIVDREAVYANKKVKVQKVRKVERQVEVEAAVRGRREVEVKNEDATEPEVVIEEYIIEPAKYETVLEDEFYEDEEVQRVCIQEAITRPGKKLVKAAGDRYGVRYAQVAVINAACARYMAKKQQAELDDLRQELAALKAVKTSKIVKKGK